MRTILCPLLMIKRRFMFNIVQELQKFNLTPERYEQLLKECSDKVAKISDKEWSEIVQEYGIDLYYDTARKASQTIFGGSFVKQYYEEKYARSSVMDDDEYFKKLRIEKQEIQKEKRKLQDERLDLNKRLRETARSEEFYRLLGESLRNIGKERYIDHSPILRTSSNTYSTDMIVTLSDLHIGASFYNFDGCYDSSVAEEHLTHYLEKSIEIGRRHNVKKVVVLGLGDYLSGSIHPTISITNKENVVEQIKKACELVSDFVYSLSQFFDEIEVHAIAGNHSRMGKKDEVLVDERLDSLIPWFTKNILSNIQNIKVELDEVDSTLATFFVRDKLYFGVHGDYDGFSETAVAKLCLWAKMTPYCIVMGHKHFPATTEVSGIKVVQCGSLCGSGDDFTREKRLTGRPSQTILICNEQGIEANYTVEFLDK